MNPFDDETLMRRLDGELDEETSQALDRAASTDVALAARLKALQDSDRALQAAFPVTVDARDADLARKILGSGRATAARRWDWRAWLTPSAVGIGGGLAVAGFIAGALIGPMTGDRSSSFVDADGLIADGKLVQVLDRRLAADGPDAAGRAVGLTFEATDGRWCRTFVDGDAALAGLACRSGEGWSIEALSPADTAGSEMRMAGAEVPASILAAVDALIAGETIAAAEEARTRDLGFR